MWNHPTWINTGNWHWTTTTTASVTTTYWPDRWINVTTLGDAYTSSARSASTSRVRGMYVDQILYFANRDPGLVAQAAPPIPRRPVPNVGGARTRARETLLSLLSPEARREFEAHGRFKVRGSAGGQYIVEGHSHSMNVLRADSRLRLCAHPRMHEEGGDLPREDALIAQLLMLQFDEPGFLAIANREQR